MAMTGARLTLRLLGEMEVRRGSDRVELPPSRKSRALLAYLAATARPQRRERLCSLFWEVPDDPRGALRWSLSRLRAALEEGGNSCLIADREKVELDHCRCSVDLLRLRAIDRSRLYAVESERLLEALELFQGDFLEGLDLPDSHEFQSWCLAEREDLRRFHVELLRELRRRHEADPEAELTFLRRLVQVDPFDEEARVDLLRLLLATKRRREAQGHFETAERLFQELGSGSAERLRRAWRQLLRDAGQAASCDSPAVHPRPPDSRTTAAALASRSPVMGQERRAPPLVGRDALLRRLTDLLEQVPNLGSPQVVLLLGEPGLGKSRLLAELADHAAELGAGIFIGHCYDSRRGAAYAPWEEAIQGLPILEAEGDPQLRRQQLFQAVTSAVLGGPEGRWLLGFEDIQWMDEASCDLLSFLLRAARNLPLLVLLTAREGELVDNPACSGLLRELRQKSLLECQSLLPLSSEETKRLVAAVGSASDLDRVVSLSQGNPLYALELARGLAEGQSLPGSLKELIRDRLEALSSEAAELLRWASLFNAGVSAALLEALAELGSERYLHAMETLERHGLLLQEGKAHYYSFNHEVVRQAIYTSLSEPRRRVMHLKVAHLLRQEAFRAEANPFDLVHHAAAGGDQVIAAKACVDAGRRAARLLANAEALMLVRRGQQYAEDLPEPLRTERYIELAEIELSTRSLEEPEAFARRLEQLAGVALDHGQAEQAWRCYKMMADIRWAQGSWADARRDILHAELISRSTSDEERVAALGEAARCLAMLERDLDFAEALVLEAGDLARRLGRPSDAVADATGLLAAYRGESEVARQAFLQARLLARGRGDRLDEFLALSHLVVLELEEEKWEELCFSCDELVALAEKIRPGGEQPFAAALQALCQRVRQGQRDTTKLDEALQRLRIADSKQYLGVVCLSAARVFLHEGRLERAEQLASEALEAAKTLHRSSAQASALTLLAEISSARGEDGSLWQERLVALAQTAPAGLRKNVHL